MHCGGNYSNFPCLDEYGTIFNNVHFQMVRLNNTTLFLHDV